MSGLAVQDVGVERGAYDGDGVSKLHHITAGVNPYAETLQHFQSVAPVISAGGVSARVQETKAERHARGFARWDQFVAMLFAQLRRAHSLREICGGSASCEGKLAHLGVAAPRRATLAIPNS